MALCTVTGIVYLPTGEPARSRVFVFSPANKNIGQQSGLTVVPDDVWVKTDRLGNLSVTLLDGRYVLASGLEASVVVVPDAPTATLSEIMGVPDLPVPDAAPLVLSSPVVSGDSSEGSILTATLGSASGSPVPTASRQWFADGVSIPGATSGTLDTIGLVGQSITHRVTWSNGVGSPASADSNAITVTAAIDAVVVMGASLMNSMFGKSLTTANSTGTSLLAAEGHNLPVYGWATNGAQLDDAVIHYNEIRAAFPNALILCHLLGGGNITSVRPYPGGQAEFDLRLAELAAAAEGDTRFYPASITFRDYDDTTFINPDNGSKPYNENIIIPWIAANFPHAMAPYGRPKLDYYRRSILDFETWLQTDNIHLTATGVTQFREWIIARTADLLEGVTPAEITERVYVAPPVTDYPLSIINFTGEAFTSEFQAPRNNVFGNAATVDPNPLPNILDVNGATTGLSMSHAYTGSPNIGATAPGRGANSNGNIGGLPAYNGTLLSSNIVGANAYITSGVTMLMTISGAVPGAQYEFGMVGSRNAADVRETTVTIAGTATTWNTSEATPQERRVTVTAAGDGTIPIVVAPAGAALAYLGGLSIRRLQA